MKNELLAMSSADDVAKTTIVIVSERLLMELKFYNTDMWRDTNSETSQFNYYIQLIPSNKCTGTNCFIRTHTLGFTSASNYDQVFYSLNGLKNSQYLTIAAYDVNQMGDKKHK